MDAALMPPSDTAPACSSFTRSIAVRPAGSGLCLERIILVSLPEPWPKPALGHPLLKSAAGALRASVVASRVFAAVPWSDTPTVEVYEREASSGVYHRFTSTFDDAADLHRVVSAVVAQPLGRLGLVSHTDGAVVAAPTLLLCTQGSHDLCCGRHGNELADAIAADRPDITLRRVSHTGGHRFAPTLLALPSGRMWAWADLALIDRIVAGTETAADLASLCRGSLTVTKGPAQVAELAARIHWAHEPTVPFTVAPLEPNTDDLLRTDSLTRWSVCGVHDDELVVQVRPGREIPSIACESPGGLPVKVTSDYQWKIGDQPWIESQAQTSQALQHR